MLVASAGNFTYRAVANAGNVAITLTVTGGNWTIDWGDGTTEPITNATRLQHTYAAAYNGNITLTCDNRTDEPREINLEGFAETDVSAVPAGITNVETDAPKVYCNANALPPNIARVAAPAINAANRRHVDRILALGKASGNTPIILLGSHPAQEDLTGLAGPSEIVPPRALSYPSQAQSPYARFRSDGVATMVAGLKGRTGTPRPHQPGRCATFDGVGDVVSCGNIIDAPNALTLSIWVKLNGANTNKAIVSKYSSTTGFLLYTNDGTIRLSKPAVGLVTSSAIASDVWHHVCAVIADGAWSLYLDGVLQGSMAGAQPTTNNVDFRLGQYATSGFLNGQLFDARAYSRALTASEISRLASMNADSTDVGPTDSLLGWWPLGENEGTVALDASGNGNDGTVTTSNLTAFRAATDANHSLANMQGYSTNGTLIVPLQASGTVDAQGNSGSIVGTGPVPRDPVLKTPCLTLAAGDTATAGASVNLGGVVTVAAWVNATADTTLLRIGPTGNSHATVSIASGVARARTLQSDGTTTHAEVTGGPTISDGQWHLVVAQFEPADADPTKFVKLWVDGVLIGNSASGAGTWNTPAASAPIAEGTFQLAKLASWAQEMTIAEHASLAANEDVAGSLFWYECNEGDGLNLWDRSDNASHGVIAVASVPAAWANKWTGSLTTMRDGYFLRDQLGVKTAVPKRISQSFAADGNSINNGPGVLGPHQTLQLNHDEPNSPFANKYLTPHGISAHDYDGGTQAFVLYSPASNNSIDILESPVGASLQAPVQADYDSR